MSVWDRMIRACSLGVRMGGDRTMGRSKGCRIAQDFPGKNRLAKKIGAGCVRAHAPFGRVTFGAVSVRDIPVEERLQKVLEGPLRDVLQLAGSRPEPRRRATWTPNHLR
jgi:hypothetical protein